MAHYYLETESGRNGDSAWPLWGLAMSLVVAVSRLFPQLPTRFHSFARSLLFSSVPAPLLPCHFSSSLNLLSSDSKFVSTFFSRDIQSLKYRLMDSF